MNKDKVVTSDDSRRYTSNHNHGTSINDNVPPPGLPPGTTHQQCYDSLASQHILLAELGPYDVLFGRGTGTNTNKGNIHFREILQEAVIRCKDSGQEPEASKSKITQDVLSQVKAMNGYFVRKLTKDEMLKCAMRGAMPKKPAKDGKRMYRYIVVPASVAEYKTKQSIRFQLEKVQRNIKGNKGSKTNLAMKKQRSQTKRTHSRKVEASQPQNDDEATSINSRDSENFSSGGHAESNYNARANDRDKGSYVALACYRDTTAERKSQKQRSKRQDNSIRKAQTDGKSHVYDEDKKVSMRRPPSLQNEMMDSLLHEPEGATTHHFSDKEPFLSFSNSNSSAANLSRLSRSSVVGDTTDPIVGGITKQSRANEAPLGAVSTNHSSAVQHLLTDTACGIPGTSKNPNASSGTSGYGDIIGPGRNGTTESGLTNKRWWHPLLDAGGSTRTVPLDCVQQSFLESPWWSNAIQLQNLSTASASRLLQQGFFNAERAPFLASLSQPYQLPLEIGRRYRDRQAHSTLLHAAQALLVPSQSIEQQAAWAAANAARLRTAGSTPTIPPVTARNSLLDSHIPPLETRTVLRPTTHSHAALSAALLSIEPTTVEGAASVSAPVQGIASRNRKPLPSQAGTTQNLHLEAEK